MPRRENRPSVPRSPHRTTRARRIDWEPFLIGLAALAALIWASRGAPLGVPAADDYDYLHALRLEQPLDPLGPMGSLWYWRPLSRQLYYAALDGAFFTHPALVAALHVVLLAAFFGLAYRTARRAFDPWGAATIAAFPLLAEPTRALLSWPTGAQPLLAMTLVALALHEATAKRAWTAALALLGALLCHEQALLAVPVVPLAFHLATRDRAQATRMLALTLGVAAVYTIGRVSAFGHGAGLPDRGTLAEAALAAPALGWNSLQAQLDLATLERAPARWIGILQVLLVGAALGLVLKQRDVRARMRSRALALSLGAAWFMVGTLPLAFAAGLWTPRHTSLPSLGLGLLFGGALACAAPALALAFTGVRLVALLLAPTAPSTVPADLTAQTTPMSFLYLARLQRTADSARRALTRAHPNLPPGTTVRYWSLPRETRIAFADSKAVQAWYRDSTLTWEFWDRYEPGKDRSGDPILGFNLNVADPAVVMRPGAVMRYQDALSEWTTGNLAPAEQAFLDAVRLQQPPVGNFTCESVRLLARIDYARGLHARADSLNRIDFELSGRTPSFFGMEALIALAAGDSARAERAARECLALRPNDEEGLEVMRVLGR